MMSQHFQHRQITVAMCCLPHEHRANCFPSFYREAEVIEWKGTGLGIERVLEKQGCERYCLVHLTSGRAFPQRVKTMVEAACWLRKIAHICDWTQPAESIVSRPDIKQVQDAVDYAWACVMFERITSGLSDGV